jgi:hypothetical protein
MFFVTLQRALIVAEQRGLFVLLLYSQDDEKRTKKRMRCMKNALKNEVM